MKNNLCVLLNQLFSWWNRAQKSPSTMTNQAPYPFEAGDSRKSPRVFVPRNIEKDVEVQRLN